MDLSPAVGRKGSILFSVIIPTFRRPLLVMEALESVRGQTLRPQEIILVESPSAFMILPTTLGSDVNLVRSSISLSSGAARNLGAARASGEYLCFLDDDDLWDSRYLESVSSAIEAESSDNFFPDLVYGNLYTDRGVSARSPRFSKLRSVFWVNPGITGSNIVVKREFFAQLGGFDESISPSEDRDFIARTLIAEGKIVFAEDALATIRSVSGQRISTKFVRSNLLFVQRYWTAVSASEKALMVLLMLYKIAKIPKNRILRWVSSRKRS